MSWNRKRRFQLLYSGAQALLYRQGAAWVDMPRVVGCHRHRTDDTVGVRRAKDGSGARLQGVMTCGSPWHCPVCAERISSERRDELQRASAAWQGKGGGTYLLTLTHPHALAGMPLAEQLDRLRKARDRFKNSRTFKRMRAEWEIAGYVTALEITWSARNGWHPHLHLVLFARRGLADRATNRDLAFVDWHGEAQELAAAWCHALMRAGLATEAQRNDVMQHGLDLQGGAFVAEYLAKFGREPEPTALALRTQRDRWGLHAEVTRFVGKVSRADESGFTPFGLLADYVENRNAQAGALFVEYAEAIAGARQLVWTPGLKRQLGVAELDDQALAARDLPAEESFMQLEPDDWTTLLRHLRENAVARLLDFAAAGDRAGADRYLAELRSRPPTNRGAALQLYIGSARSAAMSSVERAFERREIKRRLRTPA